MNSPRRAPVIADVARAAGVSVPTVSRVLTGSTPVSDEKRERVLRAIEMLGYRPNAAARALVRGVDAEAALRRPGVHVIAEKPLVGSVASAERVVEAAKTAEAASGARLMPVQQYRFGRGAAEARALEPSEVVIIPYSAIKEIYDARPELLWSVTSMLVGRLHSIDDALADSVFLDVTGRTAKRLLELAGDAEEFSLPITQEELAGMVGASRERVNKAIASFIRLGWIEQNERRYRITDREQLSRRAI